MTVTKWGGALAAVLLASGCATTPGGASTEAAAAAEFVKTGEVAFRGGRTGGSASFGADRVVGPYINMTRQGDGSWGGVYQNQGYLLTVTPGRIVGNNFLITYEETLDGVALQGQVQGRIFRYLLTSEKFEVRNSSTSMTLPLTDKGTYGPGTVRLEGDANKLPAQMPQLALAIVAAMGT